jgi:hypothetical protein
MQRYYFSFIIATSFRKKIATRCFFSFFAGMNATHRGTVLLPDDHERHDGNAEKSHTYKRFKVINIELFITNDFLCFFSSVP